MAEPGGMASGGMANAPVRRGGYRVHVAMTLCREMAKRLNLAGNPICGPLSFGFMQFWHSFCPREVNGLAELPVLKRIVKRHPLGARLGKDRGKPLCERLVWKVVRPKPEDAGGKKVCGERLQPRGLIKGRVLPIEKEVWRMVDVDQNGMKPSRWGIRIKTLL